MINCYVCTINGGNNKQIMYYLIHDCVLKYINKFLNTKICQNFIVYGICLRNKGLGLYDS